MAKGECAAIQGPSGSGKSLLLRAIADLDPNEGHVQLDDLERAQMPAFEWRRNAGLVPAESGWWSDRVEDHFKNPGGALQIISALGLQDSLGWNISRLSTGERQRLALARALCLKPKALLLDEPTASLDETSTELVENILQEQLGKGVALVLVTHDPAQAERLAQQQFTMSHGIFNDQKAIRK